ncbi:MAG: type I DNA topoisomerase [Candidatus Omnitrophica bacterium]|nr:type I DNA topoisomerase [Candidatus Omnitrophota bacterium]
MVVKKSKRTKKKKTGAKFLVIVESPAKSKTINKILGKDYRVVASMGHIIDLPLSKMGIDFENNFKPEYVVVKGRKKYLSEIKKEAKGIQAVFLAADPDREGEAICWHLKEQLDNGKIDIFRVSFDEITKKAVENAFENPRQIDMSKVNAQQARRILDRIVGYSLSPLLWKKITRGLSAGRVQSVAVKLIVEREEEIRKFNPEEYWSMEVLLKKLDSNIKAEDEAIPFSAKLVKYKGEKAQIPDAESIDEITAKLKEEKFIIHDVGCRDKKSYPRSPYTTSLLQQDAFNKLNFSAGKTMSTAQRLYEGVELGEKGSVGLITYMRTDSVRISDEAKEEAKKYVIEQYGEKYIPEKSPEYKAKKRAQEAHEAIRPTSIFRSPKEVAPYLDPNEYKLYNLIWKRFISSQMDSAVYSVLSVHIDAGDYRFRAGGGRLIFDGFLRPYIEDGQIEKEIPEIPPLEAGEETLLEELIPAQHFTKAPPRYTDASLVKMLEEKGIGRPSTYAPIIRTIVYRNYIKRLDRSLQPTDLGELVNKLLIENFSDIVNDEFTAKMENELDSVEEGIVDWVNVLKDFYSSFSKDMEKATESMKNVKRQAVETGEDCPKCGKPMVVKWGRRGQFLSCSDFPACRHSESITTGVKCPEENCDGELVERKSRRGAFYGCTKYPKCTYTTRKLPAAEVNSDSGTEAVEEE